MTLSGCLLSFKNFLDIYLEFINNKFIRLSDRTIGQYMVIRLSSCGFYSRYERNSLLVVNIYTDYCLVLFPLIAV